MKIYFVSMFGDISVETVLEGIVVKTNDLTNEEQKIMGQIVKKLGPKALNDKEDFENMNIIYKNIKIGKIYSVITSCLKGKKSVIQAMKISSGEITLIDKLPDKDDDAELVDAEIVVVDKPIRGCPMPTITERKEKRATDVLKVFLTDVQLSDYEKTGSFISKGNWSNSNYIVCSRWSPNVNKFGQLYNLATGKVLCAQCFDMPPAEELLSLKLSIEHMEREFLNTAYGH